MAAGRAAVTPQGGVPGGVVPPPPAPPSQGCSLLLLLLPWLEASAGAGLQALPNTPYFRGR